MDHYAYFVEIANVFERVTGANDTMAMIEHATCGRSLERNVTRGSFRYRNSRVIIQLSNGLPRPVSPEGAAHSIIGVLMTGKFDYVSGEEAAERDLLTIVELAALQ